MIFLDANFFINLYIETNENHERAKEINDKIAEKEKIISRLVLAEVITVLNMKIKASNEQIKNIYKQLDNNFDIIEDHYFHDKALEKLLKYDEKDLSLFDCVYMALMEELGIKEIATFDSHFDNKEEITRILSWKLNFSDKFTWYHV